METTLPPTSDFKNATRVRTPVAWLRSQSLTREYWIFFAVAFFFDAGFAVYFFLFNLFLLDAHATERTIGLINGAFTLGSTLVLLPAGVLGRRWGVKPLLLTGMLTAPILGAFRVLYLGWQVQVALGLLAGAAMSLWVVCYLPAVARLTTEENRASAYSLIFSASVATSAIGGAITGFLPRWLKQFSLSASEFEVHRAILLCACAIAAIAIWPALRLDLPAGAEMEAPGTNFLSEFRPTPFLLRFLPLHAMWMAIIGAFIPFANVYLARDHRLSMQNISLLFSSAQCLQLLLGLLTPVVLRICGLLRGILVIQLTTILSLAALALSRHIAVTIALYLLFTTVYWMCSPALYNLLMSNTRDEQRSHAAAMAMFLNTLASSFTIAMAGSSFSRFGYKAPLLSIAGAGALVSIGMFRSVRSCLAASAG
jgi:MFS family permease